MMNQSAHTHKQPTPSFFHLIVKASITAAAFPVRVIGRILYLIFRFIVPVPEISTFGGTQFEEALRNGRRKRLLRRLRKRSNELINYEALRPRVGVQMQHDNGIEIVKIDQIIGSVGRVNDFDRNFMPISNDSRHRWEGIENILKNGGELPPVELYRIGDLYFVIDGNHRISVCRYYGLEFIDAHVIELDTRTDIRTTTEARMVYAL